MVVLVIRCVGFFHLDREWICPPVDSWEHVSLIQVALGMWADLLWCSSGLHVKHHDQVVLPIFGQTES